MGLLKAFSRAAFKIDEKGRTCFFPYGIIGKGFLVNNDLVKSKIERFLRFYYLVGFCLLVCSLLFGLIASIFVFIILCLVHLIVISTLTKDLSICTTTKLTIEDTVNSQVIEYKFKFLWLFFIVSVMFVIFGIVIVIYKNDQFLIGLSGILFFGLASFAYGYFIYKKKKDSKG